MPLIPQRLPHGSQAWLSLEVLDFIKRLEEYRPDLALVKNNDETWSIWRVDSYDASEHHILKSPPGAKLGPHVIEQLKRGDIRFHDPIERMIANNDRVQRERDQAAAERLKEAEERVLSKAWRGPLPVDRKLD